MAMKATRIYKSNTLMDFIKDYEQRMNERAKFIKECWLDFLSKGNIVIFDTETSGLNEFDNDILSLSWQVTDSDFRTIKAATRYFDWPNDEDRVTKKAIEINGLTKERLAELGTSDRKESISEFLSDVKKSILMVAHNINFDYAFVYMTARRYELPTDILESSRCFCTMTSLTEYCHLDRPGFDDGYKWPRLSEAAEILQINTNEIEWHKSESDTEIVRRIMKKIVTEGIVSTFP